MKILTCVKRTDYLDYSHTNEAVIHSKPSSKSLLLLSRIQILMNQVHAEQSEEESSIIEDETSLEDDINFEDLEDPTTTGDTDDGSLSSAPEQQLICREKSSALLLSNRHQPSRLSKLKSFFRF